jgi:alpha-galactosidase
MRSTVSLVRVLFWMTLALEPGLVWGQALRPTAAEMDRASRWAQAKLEGKQTAQRARPELVVLENNDPVQRNSRAGQPMVISGQAYSRGLYCHAKSKIIVKLAGPGDVLRAHVGVDSNSDTVGTAGGRGSVVFSVSVTGKQAFQSEIVHEGRPAIPVKVDLNGASEFTLEVSDAGDGISCDQADWADAQVLMRDGSTFWLGDLPFADDREQDFGLEPPFSFTYGGKPFAELVRNWKVERSNQRLDEARTAYRVTYSDPASGLVARCEGIVYSDFPTVEWTVHLANKGGQDTALIENLKGLDTKFQRGRSGEFLLHHSRGTTVEAKDLEPLETLLGPGVQKRLASVDGRPCSTAFPYFNVVAPGSGVIVAVGWPGQWAAELARDGETGLQIGAGQEKTRFQLHPKEEVRTPLIVLQFHNGDWIRSQNLWRRWMIAHNLPRPGGQLPQPIFTPCSSHQYAEMTKADEASQKMFIDRYIEEGMKPDYWWMDAGWYKCDGNWPKTGTWEVDEKRFPRGLRAVSDHAHPKDVKIIVWFEPERVAANTWLSDKHPEWLLKSSPSQTGGDRLLNLGNPEALRWVTDHVDGLLKSQGIDLYRQDYNIGPLGFWRSNDAENRQGITENLYVVGYLAYWDALLKKNPNLLIDSCASGGHRNDLETMRRSVPMLRSDYIFEPIGQQGHTYGHAFWLPFFGTGTKALDVYTLRSSMCSGVIGCWDLRDKALDYRMLRGVLNQWRQISQEFYGDYYPLTPYSITKDSWIGWQFNRPEVGRGAVQVYRRQECVYESARLRLQGLDPEAAYVVQNLDEAQPKKFGGRELMEKGLLVPIPERPGSAWITFERQ